MHLYKTSASPDDRRLLALLVRPVPLLGARLAGRLWGANMGLGVDEAARRVAKADQGVLRALEEGVAVERLHAVGARAFVRVVLGDADGDGDTEKEMEMEMEERERALGAARAIGGRVGALAGRVGRVLGGGELDLDMDAEDGGAGAGDDVEKLLRAIVLYRRVFGSGSGASASAEDARALRRTLGSSDVFEDALVEEARDRVVDLLTGEE
ncbi:hypothetical protein C8R44DRAFT_394150 [Mycena epipterygia]|nr:hypothetical protein C8R44DRAFT_394150 [Mycena epipterygia]